MAETRGGSLGNGLLRLTAAHLRSTLRAGRDLWLGVSGQHAYDAFVAHCRTHHPDRAVPSREEFFRRDFVERWNGVRRCC